MDYVLGTQDDRKSNNLILSLKYHTLLAEAVLNT